jgi:hypothetical protein
MTSRILNLYFGSIFAGAGIGGLGMGSGYAYQRFKETQGGSVPFRVLSFSSAFFFGGALGIIAGGLGVAFSPVLAPLVFIEYQKKKEFEKAEKAWLEEHERR